MRGWRHWTDWELSAVARLAARGRCAEDIGAELGRSEYAVRRRAAILGVPLPRQGKPNLLRQANLLDYLALNPGATFGELGKALGCTPQTAWRMLNRLQRAGLVVAAGRRCRGVRYRVVGKWGEDTNAGRPRKEKSA